MPHLQTINEEVMQLQCLPSGSFLPDSVGGTQVDLLIGNQDPYLDPERIATLPCGLSVFRSPFVDVFGSNICFGGPHPLFTETNRANHFSSFMLAHFIKDMNSHQAQLLANPTLFLPTPDILEVHTRDKCSLGLVHKEESAPNGIVGCCSISKAAE